MATHDQTHDHDEHDDHHGVTSVLTYVLVLAALMVLVVITVAVSFTPIPAPWATVIALVIAFTKVAIVMYFFMHLNHTDSSLVWLFAGIGFFWIVIMMLITLGDYFARTSIPGTI